MDVEKAKHLRLGISKCVQHRAGIERDVGRQLDNKLHSHRPVATGVAFGHAEALIDCRADRTDGGPSAARTALAYSKPRDEMYVFQGGSYTPDNVQDLFRGLGSDTAVLLDGGTSSAIVLRRDTGGMWAGAGVPKGNCDTREVLCDSHERSLPGWLAFN